MKFRKAPDKNNLPLELTVWDVCQLFFIEKESVRLRIQRGTLKGYKNMHNQWMFSREEIQRILREEQEKEERAKKDFQKIPWGKLPTLLLFKEVCDILRVSPNTVRRLMKTDQLKSGRLPNGDRRFNKIDIKKLLQMDTLE